MADLVIKAASVVTPADLNRFQFGKRFGRLDSACQLGLAAVEALGMDFAAEPRADVGICVATNAGSLSTDVEYWCGRNEPGGASPTLFVYTLPSSILGEIAIRHGLTGPNLCLLGGSQDVLAEAGAMLRHDEARACIVVSYDVVTPLAAATTRLPEQSRACAVYLQRGGAGRYTLTENDRDLISLCVKLTR